VLPDEQIPSGEGLVRNRLLGAADAERLGGRLDVLYSPDAFGHPAAWPTLAREFGIRYGVVWRGLGGETGQERDLYRWRGLDDKEVLLWHLPRAGYEIGAALPADAERLFAAWAPVRGALVQRATGKHVPVFIGADHHGAHPDVPRRWRGAREGATAGRCSSSRGVRWCAVSSMMPSRAARPTTSRARSSRASRASRRCRGRWCGAVCTISCTTIPMRRAAARRRRRP